MCRGCGCRVALEALDEVPECPTCGGVAFRRASLFDATLFGPRPGSAPDERTLDHPVLEPEGEHPDWLAKVRSELSDPGSFIAFLDDDEPHVVKLTQGWSRIGRSATADIRFDDPTVSRRHAQMVKAPEGIRVLDDRSLNGIYVNGERVEWSKLDDGDEIAIGRYQLHLVER